MHLIVFLSDFSDGDPFGRVEVQHLRQQVQSVARGLGFEPLSQRFYFQVGN